MKTLTTLFLTAMSSVMLAQIPNPSFENWTGVNPMGTPNGWYNVTGYYNVFQSLNPYVGNYSLELETTLNNSTEYGGLLSSGTITNPYFATGMSSNPAALTGWYQLNLQGGDEFEVTVFTIQAGNNNGLGTGTYTGTVAAWKQFSVCITYTSGIADSAFILFELANSSNANSPTNPGSTINIDDLAWGTCVTGVDNINDNVTLEPSYPNPANDICNIIFSIPGKSSVSVSLYDLEGRKMMNLMDNANLTSGRYKIPVDVHNMANGVYFYTITVDGVPYTQKLVVAK